MTATAIKRRGGTTVQHSTFTGLNREITIDDDLHTAVVHDGVTPGGHPLLSGAVLDSYAPLASPALTGNPTAPTQSPGNDSTRLATTGFVEAVRVALINGAAAGFDTLGEIETAVALKAPLASPTFTGTPAAPTAAPGTDTTQVATTGFVAALGALKADLASPALTGNPTAPTQSAGNNSTRLATTAYVDTADALKANLASPTFTGDPKAPTPTAGDNDTSIATTAFVKTAVDGARYSPGHINGLALTNDAGDATNDIATAVGTARSGDDTANIDQTVALVKRYDAAWAVGSGNGGNFAASATDGLKYIWEIKRPDTGVVDQGFSTSSTDPSGDANYPAAYTVRRVIGYFTRTSGVNGIPVWMNTDYRPQSGTWAPTIAFGGAAVGVTYGPQTGSWIKEGPLFWFEGRMTLTSKGSSTGNATVPNLPLPVTGNRGNVQVAPYTNLASITTISGECDGGTRNILFYNAGATGTAALTNSNFANNSDFRFVGSCAL